MHLDIATHQTRAYTVATPVYAGPLDLLLQLIERAELDITTLALAQVTDQYLAHLRALPVGAAEEVSAFLVVAARLIQIKSEALLPRPIVRAVGEEDPGEALARQLLNYQRFKQSAALLAAREAAGLRSHLHLGVPTTSSAPFDLGGVTLAELAAAARRVFGLHPPLPPLASVVAAPRVTIREKIRLIAASLRGRGRTLFTRLLPPAPSNLDVVVTFLALLELIKRRLVEGQQERLFGPIELTAVGSWDESEAFELEFGE